jgi:GTPase SAR1 family protein
LLWRTPARLIAVLGSYNVGKTCLLTSFFLQLANGQRASFPYRFASSLTLHGFRDLMEHADEWTGKDESYIVPRTSIGADTVLPRSFLHVGLRPEAPYDERHIHMLLSDIPGEWVKAWTGHAKDTISRHMAFIQRCDAFIVLADAEALMEKGGGRTDTEVSLLIRRIAEDTQNIHPRPPLALVLSKFDRVVHAVLPPPPERRLERTEWGPLANRVKRIWLALEEAQRARLHVDIFPVSAFPHSMKAGQPVGVMDPFTYVMRYADKREPWGRMNVPIPEGARGFATLRRWREEP